MGKETSDRNEFGEIFSKAIESLTSQQLRVYNLHLLGWMNQDIAEELQIGVDQVSIALYEARGKVRDFLKEQGYSSGGSHQEILFLQKQDLDLLSEILISKRATAAREEISEQNTEHSAVIVRIGHLKDACIKAENMSKNILRFAELLGSTLSEGYKEELLGQLAEYQAAQDGLEKSPPAGVDFDTLWERALSKSGQSGRLNEAEHDETARIKIPMEAEKEIMIIYTTRIDTCILQLPYRDRLKMSAAAENRLVHEKGDFRWEILQEGTNLLFSMATKQRDLIGKYVVISVKSASKVDYSPEQLQWKQEGPEIIGSVEPIDTGGRVEIVIAETKLDMNKEDDFRLLQQIFADIRLDIYAEKREGSRL